MTENPETSIDFQTPRFLIYWAFGTAIGLGLSMVGFGLSVFVAFFGLVAVAFVGSLSAFDTAKIWLVGILILFVATTPLGFTQSMLLKRTRLRLRWWFLRTTLSFIIGSVAALVVSHFSQSLIGFTDSFMSPSQPHTLRLLAVSGAMHGILIGASVGFAQWTTLRHQFNNTKWWLVSSILGSAIAFTLAFSQFMLSFSLDMLTLVVFATGSLGYGIIMSMTLRFLLRYDDSIGLVDAGADYLA